MTYLFSGFFAVCDKLILQSALERWSVCDGKVISQPFMGVSCYDEFDTADTVKTELPYFSKQFPAIDFVWIEVECFGGECDYCGFVCRDGQTILFEDWPDDTDASAQALARLLTHLGVKEIVFAPFERGYFTNT